jgi:hypothetical protein
MDSTGSVKPQEVLTVLVGQRPSPISQFDPLFVHPLLDILRMFLEPVIAATEPFLPRAHILRTHDLWRTQVGTMQC